LLKFGKADAKVFTTAKAGWRARFQEVQGRATLDAGRRLGGQGHVQMVQHGLDVFFRLSVAGNTSQRPSTIGIQTSTIWIVASFSSTAAGVSPGA
jgi:hypothetical protein